MLKYREDEHISLETMSHVTGVSVGLLSLIEGGNVTHPHIAKIIQQGYSLSDKETEMLMPEIHRESSVQYNPDKFKDLNDRKQVVIVPYHEHELIDLYISDHRKKKEDK